MNDPSPPATPSLSPARRARALLERCPVGILSTILRDESATPYGSLVTFAVSHDGDVVLLLSKLAEHSRNLEAEPRASLLVSESFGEPGTDPLAMGRLTVLGKVEPCRQDELDADRAAILARHPSSERTLGFADFGLYRLRIERARIIGGFGAMSWIWARAWREAWA